MGTPKKLIFGLDGLVGGAMNMAGNAQQFEYDKYLKKMQSKLNREEMEHSMGLQKSQQEWLMNTQYNKQVSGMKNAGLNPAMANGGSVGGISGSSGTPTTGSAGSGMSGGNFDYGSTVMGLSQNERRLENESKIANAQADALSAQAEKDRKQAGLTQKDIDSYGDRLAADLANKDAQTALFGSKSAEAKENAELLRKKGDEIQENIKLIQQRVNESKANETFTRTQEREYKRIVDAQVKSAFSSANWSDTQAANMVQEALFKWSAMASDADAKDAERLMTDAMRRLVEKYGDAEKVANIISQIIRSIGDASMDMLIGSKLGAVGKGAKLAGAGYQRAKRVVTKYYD